MNTHLYGNGAVPRTAVLILNDPEVYSLATLLGAPNSKHCRRHIKRTNPFCKNMK